jgi:hypothetical protein
MKTKHNTCCLELATMNHCVCVIRILIVKETTICKHTICYKNLRHTRNLVAAHWVKVTVHSVCSHCFALLFIPFLHVSFVIPNAVHPTVPENLLNLIESISSVLGYNPDCMVLTLNLGIHCYRCFMYS